MGNTPCYAGHSVPKPYPLLPPGHRALTQGSQDTCWGPAGGLLDGERVSCATFLFLFQLLPRAGAKPQQTQLHTAACGEGEHRAREEEQELRGQFPALEAHKALLPGPAPAAGPILAPCNVQELCKHWARLCWHGTGSAPQTTVQTQVTVPRACVSSAGWRIQPSTDVWRLKGRSVSRICAAQVCSEMELLHPGDSDCMGLGSLLLGSCWWRKDI